jgi:hypothetical protein
MSSAELLHILAGPDLSGAACVAHRDLFDATAAPGGDKLYPQAIQICEQCPALDPCRRWLSGLPRSQKPFGVTAGRVHSPRPKPDAA